MNWKNPWCSCRPGPGRSLDSLLRDGGGSAGGGGSSTLGGPTSPRAVAPSAAAPGDLGRRHLSQDGSRAGTWSARAACGLWKWAVSRWTPHGAGP